MTGKRFHNPSFWFALILLSGGLARIFAAVSGFALIYPDEQFQTLEPASSVVYGFGWKSWEWYHALRSWFVPALYIPVLTLLKWLGFSGGPESIYASRIWTAFAGVIMTWRFHQLLLLRGIHPWAHALSLTALCISSVMAAWSASTFSDTWALAILWIAMPSLVQLESANRRHALFAGILIGLTFPVRVQMASWMLGLLLFFGFTKRYRRILAPLLLGYSAPVLAQGALDWITWGVPFKSTYQNFVMNVLQGVAASNGEMPWFAYGGLLLKSLGLPFLILLLSPPILALALRALQFQIADKIVFIPALTFLIAHSFVAHKEIRFLLPLYPALFYFFAIGTDAFIRHFNEVWPAPVVQLKYGAIASLTLIIAAIAWFAPYSHPPFSGADLSEASLLVYEDGGLRKNPERCLLIVDHYWVWTRGEMLLGHRVNYQEASSRNLGPEFLENCTYAIVPSWTEQEFRRKADESGKTWIAIGQDHLRNAVYRNEGVALPGTGKPERSLSSDAASINK